MKKLRLNKIFHWLYAFLMFYPILCFFGTLIIWAFNPSFVFDGPSPSNFYELLNQSVSAGSLVVEDFAEGSLGFLVLTPVNNLISSFGFDLSDNAYLTNAIGSLFSHWIIVSLFYLIFDVLMYPINLFHRWIDEGGI